MEISIFYAKFFGFHLTILGILWIVRKEHIVHLMKSVYESDAHIVVLGLFLSYWGFIA